MPLHLLMWTTKKVLNRSRLATFGSEKEFDLPDGASFGDSSG